MVERKTLVTLGGVAAGGVVAWQTPILGMLPKQLPSWAYAAVFALVGYFVWKMGGTLTGFAGGFLWGLALFIVLQLAGVV